MTLYTMLSVLPMILTVTLLLSKGLYVPKSGRMAALISDHWSEFSITVGIFAAVFIFLKREGLAAASRLAIAPRDGVLGSWYVFLGVLATYLFIFTLRETGLMDELKSFAGGRLKSGLGFFGVLLVSMLFLSIDDYLAVIGAAFIVTELGTAMGFPRAKTAALINFTAVCMATLNPFSSWMPVIGSNLDGLGIRTVILGNIGSLAGLAIVGFICLTGMRAKSSSCYKPEAAKTSVRVSKETAALVTVLAAMLICHIVTTFVLHFDYSYLASMTFTAGFLMVLAGTLGLLTFSKMKAALKSALHETLDLSVYLAMLWILVEIVKHNELLHFAADAASIELASAEWLMPVIIFIITSVFTTLIGSAYTAFSFLIALAAAVTANMVPAVGALSVSAVISGSICACFAVTSETMKMASDNTKAQIQDIVVFQWSILPAYIFMTGCGFLTGGFAASRLGVYGLTVLPFLLGGVLVSVSILPVFFMLDRDTAHLAMIYVVDIIKWIRIELIPWYLFYNDSFRRILKRRMPIRFSVKPAENAYRRMYIRRVTNFRLMLNGR